MMQLEMIVIIVHQRKSRTAWGGPRNHLHAYGSRPVAVPLTATTEKFSDGLVRIEYDNGYNSKQLGNCNRPVLFRPSAPVYQWFLDRRAVKITNKGKLKEGLLECILALVVGVEVECCQGAHGQKDGRNKVGHG